MRVDLGENNAVTIHLTIVVDYGSPIPEVAGNIQENVKKAIETMSGLTVSSVDVHVQGVSFEREQRSVAEIEQKQRLMLQKEQEEAKAEEARAEAPKTEEPKAEPEAPKAEESAPAEEEDDEGEYGGVGLGLALVREIALLHGGRVLAEESTENGTVMLVILPKDKTSEN